MPAALAGTGVTTFAADASRQPQQYSLGQARWPPPAIRATSTTTPSNWPDELNEYNTLYVAQGVSLGDPQFPAETGHCADTSATTCITTPATEADLLASESHIMLSHVLANDPRVGYAHQTDLIGPATQNGQDYGYTILDLISNMLSQYNCWYNRAARPDDRRQRGPGARRAGCLGARPTTAGSVPPARRTASSPSPTRARPSTSRSPCPPGTTVNGAAFGQRLRRAALGLGQPRHRRHRDPRPRTSPRPSPAPALGHFDRGRAVQLHASPPPASPPRP